MSKARVESNLSVKSVTVKDVSIEQIARKLARANGESDDGIKLIRWFRDSERIRLIVVDPMAPPLDPDERIAPFYFGADDAGGVPYPSAIAVVAPQDDQKAPLPEAWGTWDDSVVVWPSTP